MTNHKNIKLINASGAKKYPLANIPAKDIRVARDALAEDIVIAEIALCEKNNQKRNSTSKLIAKLRSHIDSLKHIDTFLKEVGHE